MGQTVLVVLNEDEEGRGLGRASEVDAKASAAAMRMEEVIFILKDFFCCLSCCVFLLEWVRIGDEFYTVLFSATIGGDALSLV